MPFFEPSFTPDTPYEVLKENISIGAHTLILLDIKSDQNRFMTIAQAIDQLLELENKNKKNLFNPDTFCIGCARLGSKDQIIRSGKASELTKFDFGHPLHSLIIPSELHFMEEDALKYWQAEK